MRQTTLEKWLGCRPVALEHCRDCGKTCAPGSRLPVLGEAFCSAQCAAAWAVLTCSRCEELLSAEQGLCGHWECRHGIGLPARPHRRKQTT